MCDRTLAKAAQDAAAEALQRACSAPFCSDDLRNPATVNLLPPAPAELGELVEQLQSVPTPSRKTRSTAARAHRA